MPNIRIIVLFLLIFSCNSTSDKGAEILNLTSNLKDGELTLSVNDKTQLLNEEGTIVDFHISADKNSIAVEVEKLSTLSVLKLYHWNSASQSYEADTTNINRLAWQIFDQGWSVNSDELESSHVYFIKWKGQDSIEVELRGNAGMGTFISDTVVLKY